MFTIVASLFPSGVGSRRSPASICKYQMKIIAAMEPAMLLLERTVKAWGKKMVLRFAGWSWLCESAKSILFYILIGVISILKVPSVLV